VSKVTWRVWLALAFLPFALWMGIHGLSLGLTEGDGMFEPPQVCNQECQDGWRRMANEGGRWMVTAGLLFVSGAVLGLLGWRGYCDQTLSVTVEPISPHTLDDPMR
jgi:hypothetical protein